MLKTAVAAKLSQWNREALLFCAAHGRKGGSFEINQWANGAIMVEVPGARCNQAVTLEDFAALKDSDWTFCYRS